MTASVLRTTTDVDVLRTAIVLAMERLCFTSPEAFVDDAPDAATLDAYVEFHGRSSGAVAIAAPADAVRGFVDALLLPDPRADRIAPEDFITELANIVCGNAVPRIFGRNAVHVLSPPRLGRPNGPAIAIAVVELAGAWIAATLHDEA